MTKFLAQMWVSVGVCVCVYPLNTYTHPFKHSFIHANCKSDTALKYWTHGEVCVGVLCEGWEALKGGKTEKNRNEMKLNKAQ